MCHVCYQLGEKIGAETDLHLAFGDIFRGGVFIVVHGIVSGLHSTVAKVSPYCMR